MSNLSLDTLDILGVTYTIVYEEEVQDPTSDGLGDGLYGLVDTYNKVIHICDDLQPYQLKITLRHEIIHAFLHECGLDGCSLISPAGWAINEEMVDFFAMQWIKLNKLFEKVGAL